jgi:hypothetical protein
MNNQYSQKPQRAKLLQSKTTANITQVNEAVEIDLNGNKTVVPTIEAFIRLSKKVAMLEQRLYSVDNKATRATRSPRNG